MAFPTSRGWKILLAAGAIAATLVVLEIAARLTDLRFVMVVRHPDYGSTGNRAHPDIDGDGFRNPAARGDACVVLMGDSQIFGLNLPYEVTAPRQLATGFGIETYSMAMPGHGPLHALLLLDAAIAKSPRVVVTPVYFGNDLVDVYSLWSAQRRRNAFVRIPELEAVEPRPVTDIDAAFRAGIAKMHGPPRRSRSVLLRFLAEIKEAYFGSQYVPDLRRLATEATGKYGTLAGSDVFFIDNGEHRDIFQNQARRGALDLEDPRLAAALAATGTILRQIGRRLGKAGVVHVVLLVPTKELVFAAYLRARGIVPPAGFRRNLAFEERARRRVIAELRGNGSAVLDALPVWEESLLAGNSPHLVADGHPNAHGHALVARLIAGSKVGALCAPR